MRDRVPTYRGRVIMTPVAGQTNTYDMERADEPIEEGTPYNTAAVLSNTTAALMGLTEDATPNDMFRVIANKTTQLDGKITYGTTELTPGTSTLATGTVYLCYEVE